MFSIYIIRERWYLMVVLFACFVLINIFSSFHNSKCPTIRLRICGDGCELLMIFLISSFVSVIYFIVTAYWMHPNFVSTLISLIAMIMIELFVFWNGIIRVYCTSAQLGIKWRLIGIIIGWIPLVNLIVLLKIIHVASRETNFESEK